MITINVFSRIFRERLWCKRYYEKNKDKISQKRKEQYNRAYKQRYYEANKEHIRKREAARRTANAVIIRKNDQKRYYKQIWGMSQEEYLERFNKQISESPDCPICGDPLRMGNIALDHNHDTQAIRKFLCKPCNIGLGNFKESLLSLANAIKYLEFHKEAQ